MALEQGKRGIFYCDGTNVVDAAPWRTPIANLPMGGFKFTGIANGTALTDSAAFGQIVSGAAVYGADTGAANAYVVTLPTSPGAYADGQEFTFQPANSNTATSTVNFNGVGALTMKRMTNIGIQNLVGGEIIQDGFCKVMVDASAGAIVLNPVRNELVGSIIAWGGTTAPAGTVFCFGQAVSRTAEPYAAAFAALGVTWGVGDGATTYNLPDLRGRALFGRDDMGGAPANRITNAISGIVGTTLGATGGSQSLTGHTHAGPSHTHGLTDPGHAHNYNEDSFTASAPGGGASLVRTAVVSVPTSTSATGITMAAAGTGATSSTGAGASENMPPAAIVNFLAKL